MTPEPDIHEPDLAKAKRTLSWAGWTEENGERAIGFAVYPNADWSRKWEPPCPDGDPQLVRRALGFRERSVGELELRVALREDETGVCQTVVEEDCDEVYVRVLVHAGTRRSKRKSYSYTDCPVRVWLDAPLGDRAVIDVDSDEELPLFVPGYLNNVPQPDHGYHPANRRRRNRR